MIQFGHLGKLGESGGLYILYLAYCIICRCWDCLFVIVALQYNNSISISLLSGLSSVFVTLVMFYCSFESSKNSSSVLFLSQILWIVLITIGFYYLTDTDSNRVAFSVVWGLCSSAHNIVTHVLQRDWITMFEISANSVEWYKNSTKLFKIVNTVSAATAPLIVSFCITRYTMYNIILLLCYISYGVALSLFAFCLRLYFSIVALRRMMIGDLYYCKDRLLPYDTTFQLCRPTIFIYDRVVSRNGTRESEGLLPILNDLQHEVGANTSLWGVCRVNSKLKYLLISNVLIHSVLWISLSPVWLVQLNSAGVNVVELMYIVGVVQAVYYVTDGIMSTLMQTQSIVLGIVNAIVIIAYIIVNIAYLYFVNYYELMNDYFLFYVIITSVLLSIYNKSLSATIHDIFLSLNVRYKEDWSDVLTLAEFQMYSVASLFSWLGSFQYYISFSIAVSTFAVLCYPFVLIFCTENCVVDAVRHSAEIKTQPSFPVVSKQPLVPVIPLNMRRDKPHQSIGSVLGNYDPSPMA